jgi:hypothetical protein
MSNTISLNKREITRIYELFNNLNDLKEYGTVTITQGSHSSGIGSVINATYTITHKDVDGEFTVTISDESHW